MERHHIRPASNDSSGENGPVERNGRERVLQAAYDLFCHHGIQAVGVARIVAEAGVTKMTFYRHFASKDDLVIAVLERREEVWSRRWLQREAERRGRTPRAQLLAVFDMFDEWFRRDDYEGCLFLRCVLESHDRSSRIGEASVAAIASVRSFVRDLAEHAEVHDPDRVAHQLQILMRGAILAAAEGHVGAAQQARDVAVLVLDREQQRSEYARESTGSQQPP